ncbi:DUF1592 domain-containing protein [Fulvivirgaceae bacterium BMA12]|uniref:DUF1592 domain-containing protein n=1 Tax=Agaribacillus aureus TaxID=3051825 RepID=A0ABT8L575_9BACT|nr:DUF1592 domain-containing protein [Fulvivirgaceae bacterium BMA12]
MLKGSIFSVFFSILYLGVAAGDKEDFDNIIRPLLKQKCYECHRTGKSKGGVNLERYPEAGSIIRDGQLWLKVVDQIKSRQMPPDTKPPLSEEDYKLLVEGIDNILQNSLKGQNPGHVVVRRLSHLEYQYTIEDLLGVAFEAHTYFPSDGSGGGGFDNQARALFMTPLKLERYYEAAEIIIERLYQDPLLWKKIVPVQYKITWWQRFTDWVKSLFSKSYQPSNPPELAAADVITPIASKAFRRFLKNEEKQKLTTLFSSIYQKKDGISNPQRFNESIAETLKAILISPNFLYRIEEESELSTPHPLSDFELASRLSYFLWSSIPDDELFLLAYQEKLHDTLVLEEQVKRMLRDPKAKRYAETFSSQWLTVDKLKLPKPLADPEKFPEFTPSLRKSMYNEVVTYFYHVLTERRNFLELIDSDYTFLNQELAEHYGISSVKGDTMRKVLLDDHARGGVLGMGGVLTVTSLPTRTSPVLRGKWVLEEILGKPPPPPPPDAGELPEDEAAHQDLGLRALLEIHRSKPACQSCHEKMDPLGLGLENFDAIGRWRKSYGHVLIDASGKLTNGKTFNGPADLKIILREEKEAFARNIAVKMLSYALGRSVLFTDEPALRALESCLLENDFHTEKFIIALVKSYPFRFKINDFRKKTFEI